MLALAKDEGTGLSLLGLCGEIEQLSSVMLDKASENVELSSFTLGEGSDELLSGHSSDEIEWCRSLSCWSFCLQKNIFSLFQHSGKATSSATTTTTDKIIHTVETCVSVRVVVCGKHVRTQEVFRTKHALMTSNGYYQLVCSPNYC